MAAIAADLPQVRGEIGPDAGGIEPLLQVEFGQEMVSGHGASAVDFLQPVDQHPCFWPAGLHEEIENLQ